MTQPPSNPPAGMVECKRHGPYNESEGCGPCAMLRHEFSLGSNPPAGQETTPRTDEILPLGSGRVMHVPHIALELAGLARSLERELAAAKAQLAEARTADEIVDAYLAKLDTVNPDGSTCEDIERDLLIPIRALEAQLAAAREDMKEECAKVCESLIVNRPDDHAANYHDGGCNHCAAAIRALGDKH